MSKTKRVSRKEKNEQLISKWAFTILFALCIQFLVYIFVLNVIPTFGTTKNPSAIDLVNAELNGIESGENSATVLNSFYKTDNYYTTNGAFISSVENPTLFIYYYNMVLLLATVVLILYYFANFMENNDGKMIQKIKKFLKEQWPLTILLVFMCWVFISSLLARDNYRSFVGCFNLKDGYLSFMMYGAMLVCSMLIIKNNEKYRKILVNTFLITATLLALITLWNYSYLNGPKRPENKVWYTILDENALDDKKISNGEIDANYLITYGDNPERTVVTLGELIFGNGGLPRGKNFLIVTKRVLGETTSGIFHNSNHYGYYLSICVIVAATLFMKEKKTSLSLLYMISYIIMLRMAIINNTLGAYLGIGASIIFMLIYALIPKENKFNKKEIGASSLIIAIFIILSVTTLNTKNENIVYNNFSGIFQDFKTLMGAESSNSNSDKTNSIVEAEGVSGSISGNVSGNVSGSASGNISENKDKNSNEDKVGDIGSGRGRLWEKALVMAFQKPLFGYGLENIIYEYSIQFDINEGRSHNLVLQLAATTGIVGMLLYMVGIASIWFRKLKYIKTWDIYECLGMFVIVSYIISSFVGNSGFYTSGYFYIFVGFVALKLPKQEEITVSKNKNRR